MRPTLVLNVVGLTPALLGDATPNLSALAREGGMRPLRTIVPAVTCSVQSTFTTGLLPSGYGCVANGWYFRDLSEIWFWRQSNKLAGGEKIWEAAKRRDPRFTCAKLFGWYNMYSSADYAVTPRPLYPADGRKLPDSPSGSFIGNWNRTIDGANLTTHSASSAQNTRRLSAADACITVPPRYAWRAEPLRHDSTVASPLGSGSPPML